MLESLREDVDSWHTQADADFRKTLRQSSFGDDIRDVGKICEIEKQVVKLQISQEESGEKIHRLLLEKLDIFGKNLEKQMEEKLEKLQSTASEELGNNLEQKMVFKLNDMDMRVNQFTE